MDWISRSGTGTVRPVTRRKFSNESQVPKRKRLYLISTNKKRPVQGVFSIFTMVLHVLGLLSQHFFQDFTGQFGVGLAPHFSHDLPDKPADQPLFTAAVSFHFIGVFGHHFRANRPDCRVVTDLGQSFRFHNFARGGSALFHFLEQLSWRWRC